MIWVGVIKDVGDYPCLHVKEREQKEKQEREAKESDFQKTGGNGAEHRYRDSFKKK